MGGRKKFFSAAAYNAYPKSAKEKTLCVKKNLRKGNKPSIAAGGMDGG